MAMLIEPLHEWAWVIIARAAPMASDGPARGIVAAAARRPPYPPAFPLKNHLERGRSLGTSNPTAESGKSRGLSYSLDFTQRLTATLSVRPPPRVDRRERSGPRTSPAAVEATLAAATRERPMGWTSWHARSPQLRPESIRVSSRLSRRSHAPRPFLRRTRRRLHRVVSRAAVQRRC